MRTHYDVIIVGARVAGSTLAYELSRAGFDVLLLERAQLPSDTLSTHNFFNNSVAMLREMGVLDRLLATGAPLYKRAYVDLDGAVIDGAYPEVNGESGCLCIRRKYLDAILFEHATMQKRVTAIQRFRVMEMIRENDVVIGVSGVRKEGDAPERFTARLVVGADGRRSTVRSLVKSRRLHAVPTDYASYVGYFRDFRQVGERCVEFYKADDSIAIVFPTSNNEHVVGLMFPLVSRTWIDRFMIDSENGFRDKADEAFRHADFPTRLRAARLSGPIKGLLGYDNDWFEGMGKGWALVGDALSFKDPAVGQGMHDAIYGARALTRILSAQPDWRANWESMKLSYESELQAKMMSRFGMACQITKNVPTPAEQHAVNRMIGVYPEATRAFLGIYNYANEPEELGSTIGRLMRLGS